LILIFGVNSVIDTCQMAVKITFQEFELVGFRGS